jgi:hypothetical protein
MAFLGEDHMISPITPRKINVGLLFFGVLMLFTIVMGLIMLKPARAFRTEAAARKNYERARLSDSISVHAAGRGNPYINLSDGRDVITAYDGPSEIVEALEQNRTNPLSLASADFDEDGVPDLVSGYAGPDGGIITLHRGNVDSIYPNSPEAKQRKSEGTFTEAPFLSPALVFAVPEAADFIGAGDFDGDGHWDVMATAKGNNKLHLLSGDGKGNLGLTKQVELPGSVTALIVGEINRRDGLDDVVVGVASEDAAMALVFEGPEGALRAKPEAFILPAEANSLALGQLDDEYMYDLAIAAGREVVVVHGRDRKLSLDSERQKTVKQADVESRVFSFDVKSITIGDFTGSHEHEIALLSGDGELTVLHVPDVKDQKRLASWRNETIATGNWSASARLVLARVSSTPVDNLVVIDSGNEGLQIIASDLAMSASGHRSIERSGNKMLLISLETDSEPISVMPMRLNTDALSDLVILGGRVASPVVAMTAAVETFTVRNTNDSGTGSLRQAIIDANNNPGLDHVLFSIGSGMQTITLNSPLDEIEDPINIDATSQQGFAGDPIINLRGTNNSSMLTLNAGNSVLRGIVFCFSTTRLRTVYALVISSAGKNTIEGNQFGNGASGINILSSDNNVGGTSSNAKNLFGGSLSDLDVNIDIIGDDASNNSVLGNVFKNLTSECPAGRTGLSNFPPTSLSVIKAANTIVGGTSNGARNVFFTAGRMIGLIETTGTIVQGNFIGINENGTNSGAYLEGIRLRDTFSTTIGGTSPNARNVISGSGELGVGFDGPSDIVGNNVVQGNYIGTDVSGTKAIKNKVGVTIFQARGTVIGGDTPAALNVISGNITGIVMGISLPSYGGVQDGPPGSTDILVEGNYIGTDFTGNNDLGNESSGIFIAANSFTHTIKDNRIAFNGGNGVKITERLIESTDIAGFKISILSNSIFSNRAIGIELGDDGPTQNDTLDGDSGANERQNFPVLDLASSLSKSSSFIGALTPAESTTISVTFNSTPNSTFTIELFLYSGCPTGQPQSLTFLPIRLGDRTISTDANGNAAFSFTFDFPSGIAGGWVNGTATRSDGNTSELSQCLMVGSPVFLPAITNASKNKKQLIVTGANFDSNSELLINGQVQKTTVESANRLVAKKAGKKVKPEDKLQVRNSDGTLSPEFIYRP